MKFSLNRKAILLIVLIVAIISVMAIVIYDRGIRDVISTQYEERSIEIARLAAAEIDSERLSNVRKKVLEIYDQSENKVLSDQWGTPEFNAYISQFASVEETEDFRAVRDHLRRMQDVLNVDCLYTVWFDVENMVYVYLIDAAYEDACPPGCIDPLFLEDPQEVLKNLENGFPANITNTPEYGWLITTGMPIRNSQGEIIAFSGVDISMNEIMARQRRSLIYAVIMFLVTTILVCLIGIALVNHFIVKPINTLSQAATQYKNNRNVFSELEIESHDEIGVLADSMAQMEGDINSYINDLKQTTSDLISAREYGEKMDRAANIDALTKVRNKRAYDIDVLRLDADTKPYGIVMIDLNGLKEINDTYGHEKGDIYINTVCQTVCRTFKHSPVYRVGGDEFVVILENDDYENRKDLVQSITDTFRKNPDDTTLEPWERGWAAVGCAVYEPGKDEKAEAVLKRADASMYETKKAMKETRRHV